MDQKTPEVATSSKWRFAGIVMAGVLALGVSAAGVVLVFQDYNDNQAYHGSLIDEITNLQDTNRQLQADNQKLQSAAAAPVDDTSVVTKAIRADCEAEVGMQTLSVTNLALVPPFATADVVCTNPQNTTSKKTYEIIFKKVSGTWTFIGRRSGTATIDNTTRTKYGIPVTLK